MENSIVTSQGRQKPFSAGFDLMFTVLIFVTYKGSKTEMHFFGIMPYVISMTIATLEQIPRFF
jgi:hypothetical protein